MRDTLQTNALQLKRGRRHTLVRKEGSSLLRDLGGREDGGERDGEVLGLFNQFQRGRDVGHNKFPDQDLVSVNLE